MAENQMDKLKDQRGEVNTFANETNDTDSLNKTLQEEEDIEPADKPIEGHQYDNPVDYGWAWVVLIGCFGVCMLTIGGIKSFGVLYVELAKKYQVSNQALSSVQSVAGFCFLFFAPVCNALSTRFTHRLVIFIGSVMTSTGLILSSLTPSVGVLYLTYGLIAGIGYSLSFSSVVVMVANYFNRYRSLASGIALSGGGMGAMTLPYLIRYLMNQYGLQGAILIYAGIMSNGCVFAMLLRPFFSYPKKTKSQEESCNPDDREDDLLLKDRKEEENFTNANKSTANIKNSSTPDSSNNFVLLPYQHSEKNVLNNPSIHEEHFERSLHLSAENLNETAACCQSFPQSFDEPTGKHITKNCFSDKNIFFREIKWKLFLNPVFTVYFVLIFFSMVSYHSLFNIVPPFADEIGLSGEDGALVLLIFGATDLTGRIASGVLMDIFPKRRHIIFTVCVGVTALGVILTPLFRSLLTLSLFMASYGVFAGGYNGTVMIFLVDKLGLNLLPSAWGFVCLSISIAMLINPWASGVIKDSTGTWTHAFHFTGSMSIMAVILLLVLPFIETRHKKRNGNSSNV